MTDAPLKSCHPHSDLTLVSNDSVPAVSSFRRTSFFPAIDDNGLVSVCYVGRDGQ